MSNIGSLKPSDLAALALFQATGNPVFDAESAIAAEKRIERAIAKAPPGYDFDVDGVTITVNGTYYKGSRGRFERGGGQVEPDEPPCFEVEELWIGGINITAMLCQWAPELVSDLAARALGANDEG